MERQRKTGRINHGRITTKIRPAHARGIVRRRRRIGVRLNRNRLERAENNFRNNRRGPQGRFRQRNNYRRRRNRGLRILFIGNLPRNVDNKRLYSLFRNEGKINGVRIVYNRMGLSNGYGFVEFNNPRDAFRSVRKWNNTTLGGNIITVEYRRPRRPRRNFGGNRFFDNSRRYDRPRQGFRGGRGRYMGGFRPRGRF